MTHINIYIYIHTHIFMYICIHMHAHIRTYEMYIYIYIRTYITYIFGLRAAMMGTLELQVVVASIACNGMAFQVYIKIKMI